MIIMTTITGYRFNTVRYSSNPKEHEVPIFGQSREMRYTTKYTKYAVAVHYSIPKKYWKEYDI
jgi:hypothetical protein